jgi:mono/diheme cytochrome c family protein
MRFSSNRLASSDRPDRWRNASVIASLLFGLLCLVPALALANDDEEVEALEASRDWLGGIPAAPTEDWEIGFGGRLYDSWYEALAIDEPEETHPAYPAEGAQEGASTWRCKECHGWDYKGEGGAYGSGSHATGIIGIQRMVGADPRQVREIISNDTHRFSTLAIPEEAMDRLALFVTRGQHDTDFHIDFATKKARGDAPRGERYYQNICAPCHGFDGKALNFSGDPDEPEYVGTVAAENPWETLHKIRNGQPGQPMPALRILPMQDVMAILAYAQTLPAR